MSKIMRAMQDISKELIIQASGGDMAAFEKIYRGACGFVWSVAFRVTNNREIAQDIVQEVFVKVYKNLKRFRFGASFRTWLYRITVNTAVNASKKQSRDLKMRTEYETALKHSAVPDEGKEHIDKEHRERFLAGLLAKLNPDQRACLVLREIEGLSYREIAQALKTNINTVRSRLKRARQTLLALKRGELENEL